MIPVARRMFSLMILLFSELCQRELLDKILAHAIGLPLNENGRLTVIDESSYVLTSDFVVKMLNIHERARCKVPVVIEGETGVGKTALIEMMSKLWNLAALQRWSKEREELLKLIRDKLQGRWLFCSVVTTKLMQLLIIY